MITLKGIRGGIDQTGVATFTAAFLAQDLSYEEALVIAVPARIALPEIGRTVEDWIDDSNFTINVNFRGIVARPGQGTVAAEEYTFEEEFVSRPIEQHPQLSALLTKYNGSIGIDGRASFPQKLAASGTTGTGLGNSKATGDDNPMFGARDFQELHLVAVHSYTVRSLPSDFRSKVGTVRTSLPNGFEVSGGKWLVRPSNAQRMADTGWKITDRYIDVTDTRALKAMQELLKK